MSWLKGDYLHPQFRAYRIEGNTVGKAGRLEGWMAGRLDKVTEGG
jgi:hypothetical protein